MKTKKGVEKVIKARSSLLLSEPGYGLAAMSLILTPVAEDHPVIWAMATDGVRLFFNPGWVESVPLDIIKGVIVHEVWHVWAKHDLRKEGRQHMPWNYAADAAINPVIRAAGYRLPEHAVGDEFAGLNAEAIYPKLPVIEVKVEAWNVGGVLPNPGLSKGKNKGEMEAERDQRIHQWGEAAKRAGKLPAEFERLLNELLNPRLPWKEILARFVDTSARNDFSWLHCDPECVRFGCYMPTMYSEELGLIAYIGDTSGSIDQDQHKRAVSELQGMLRSYDNASIYCMWVDHALHNPELVTSDDVPLNIHPAGGGGTSFRPGFEHMEEAGIRPKCCVYATDGYCNDFADDPGYPVLWLVVENNPDFRPPYGEVVRCDFE